MVKQTDRQNRVVCLMVVMVAAALSVASPSRSCNTHCPDPYLNLPGHYVCCDQHPGKCFRRDKCPPHELNKGLRQTIKYCHYDPECALHEKCCYDVCIEAKVCKLPE
uniref:Type I crustin 4 n=1 Tax=Scylla paramamosain TaxID=85552 RepID=A0A2K9UW25_SCYPA|nr:type I crustin 4 [Scylla paramamosain]